MLKHTFIYVYNLRRASSGLFQQLQPTVQRQTSILSCVLTSFDSQDIKEHYLCFFSFLSFFFLCFCKINQVFTAGLWREVIIVVASLGWMMVYADCGRVGYFISRGDKYDKGIQENLLRTQENMWAAQRYDVVLLLVASFDHLPPIDACPHQIQTWNPYLGSKTSSLALRPQSSFMLSLMFVSHIPLFSDTAHNIWTSCISRKKHIWITIYRTYFYIYYLVCYSKHTENQWQITYFLI